VLRTRPTSQNGDMGHPVLWLGLIGWGWVGGFFFGFFVLGVFGVFDISSGFGWGVGFS
jgi:hypothetical protein